MEGRSFVAFRHDAAPCSSLSCNAIGSYGNSTVVLKQQTVVLAKTLLCHKLIRTLSLSSHKLYDDTPLGAGN